VPSTKTSNSKTDQNLSHRQWRRQQLIDAAAAIAMESGGASISVAAVAARAGLSRTSVYEYFASSADLAADLVLDELKSFAKLLDEAIADIEDPEAAIERWIETSLRYIAEGQHLLAKALNAMDLPRERAADLGAAHRQLLAPLSRNLQSIGVTDIQKALSLLQAITDSAAKRIEAGNDAETEIRLTTAFCIAGMKALS
jgi:AcrR family transcriptional regulator